MFKRNITEDATPWTLLGQDIWISATHWLGSTNVDRNTLRFRINLKATSASWPGTLSSSTSRTGVTNRTSAADPPTWQPPAGSRIFTCCASLTRLFISPEQPWLPNGVATWLVCPTRSASILAIKIPYRLRTIEKVKRLTFFDGCRASYIILSRRWLWDVFRMPYRSKLFWLLAVRKIGWAFNTKKIAPPEQREMSEKEPFYNLKY